MRTVQWTMAVAAIACALPVGAQAAIRVQDAGVLSPVLVPGATTKVKIVVRNTGRRAARGGVVGLRLDGKPEGKGVRAGRVKGRSAKTLTLRLRLPAGTRPGPHRVTACLGRACAKQSDPIGVLPRVAPLNVTPRLAEGGLPREGVISRDGGSLYAADAAGRTYQLIVPPGALADDTRVTIRPLAGVDGLPYAGGMIAGVQLGPDGVEFARPAALIISGEGIRSEPGQALLGYGGDGRDLHRTGWFARTPGFVTDLHDPGKSILVPVEHFSGVVVAPATDLETARDLRRGAAEARNRLASDLAEKIGRERDRQLMGEEPSDLSELTDATLGEFLEQVILPEAAAASFSDAMYESAVRDFISWERQRQLLGQDEHEMPERYRKLIARIQELLRIAWDRLIERAEKRCYGGDFSILARIIPLERQRQLLGEDERPNEFSEALVHCLKFELRVVARVEHKGDGGTSGFRGSVDEAYELRSVVRLAVAAGQGAGLAALTADIVGSDPFPYAVVRHASDGEIQFGQLRSACQGSSTGQTMPGQLSVSQMVLGLTIKGPDVRRAIDPAVIFDVGDPQEEITLNCQSSHGGPSSETTFERNWLRYWAGVHQDDRTNPDQGGYQPGEPNPGPWRIDFEPRPWPLIGSYVLEDSDATYGWRVTETWELVHTPPKAPPKRG